MPKKWTPLILIAIVLVPLVIAGIRIIHTAKPEQEQDAGLPALHVEGYRLADDRNKTVQLTGMSSHGLLWYAQYTNANAMKTLKKHGANTFRVAVYEEQLGHRQAGP